MVSNGAYCARLVGWALIDSIERHRDGGTAVAFSEWKPLDGARTQELVLLDTGMPIAPDYTRPYALCKTPWFVRAIPRAEPVTALQRAWIVKGRPERNDFENMLTPGERDRWVTHRPPKDWAIGDFVFLWESGRGQRVVGLGRIVETDAGSSDDGQLFAIEYLTGRLAHPVSGATLRDAAALESASFLKAGPAGTVFPLTDSQSIALAEYVAGANPATTSVLEDWLVGVGGLAVTGALQRDDPEWEAPIDRDDLAFFESEYEEGRRKLIVHVVRERSARARALAKEAHRARTGGMRCIVCTFDYEAVYGEIGREFAEVHHVAPLSVRGEEGGPTRIADLVVVCANCHRMLHRRKPWLTIDSLGALLAANGRREA
jgi:hypothetical protein